MTGRIQIDLFTTLDLVAQAPGGPDEDRAGGFPYGGWQAPLGDEVVGRAIGAGIADLDALVLGRRTYDIFAGYWPQIVGGEDGGIADVFNAVPKYVASRSDRTLAWAGSSLLGADLASAVKEIRGRHENIHVIGSVNLVQTLLREQLFDVLNLWVYPVVLGQGKKVFPDGAAAANLQLLAPAITSPSGVVQLQYGPAQGLPRTGDMTAPDRGV